MKIFNESIRLSIKLILTTNPKIVRKIPLSLLDWIVWNYERNATHHHPAI
jgi:hypothetical protein